MRGYGGSISLLRTNVGLLRARASRHAYIGLAIAVAAVLVATIFTAYFAVGEVSLAAMLAAQKSNVALWAIDCMPFVFAFWGQYVGVLMAHEAGALILDQTEDLRTQAAAMEVQAARQTAQDNLTGLPNRTLFLDRLEQAIEAAHGHDQRVGVLVIDLDNFKEINEVLGQHNGDRVLKSVARRLSHAVSEPATVARLAGDTYAVLLPRVLGADELLLMAVRMSKGLEPPCALENLTINLQATTGSALYWDDAADADTLLNRAISAMHEAKRTGSHYLRFEAGGQGIDPNMLSMTTELRAAIKHGQLELYFQPIVRCAGDRVAGAEALIRWHHPKRGTLGPEEFIPRAERSGLITELSRWMLKRALEHIRELRERGVTLTVSVNISARVLLDPDFPDLMVGLLAGCEVPGESLVLEITEDTLMADQRRAHDILTRIAALGVQVSIDDFGSGYSQLAYLKRLPAHEIKIDRSFVQGILKSEADAHIVEASINLAHALRLRVVAEGVADEAQDAKLRELGCDRLQGPYIGRPMAAGDLPTWLAEWSGGWHAETQPTLTLVTTR